MPFSLYDALMGISEMPNREIHVCSLVPHQTGTLLPFSAGRGKKIKMVVYPTHKFGTHGAFSQWCLSAGLKPRVGFKLQTGEGQSPAVWGRSSVRLIAWLTAELFSSFHGLLSQYWDCFAYRVLNKKVKIEFLASFFFPFVSSLCMIYWPALSALL